LILKKEKILVIGGAGYLGAVVVDSLVDKGYSVRILDNMIYGDKSLRKHFENENL
jgi:UDP-glucose 4-epimerase